MRYCLYCKRLSPGHPVFCQYCGHSFEVRICKGCRHMNPPEALFCRRCGSVDLSEPSGLSPNWLFLLKSFLWILGILLLVGLVKTLVLNLELILVFFLPLGLLCFSYLFLPQTLKGLIKKILKVIKDFALNKIHNNRQSEE